MSSLALLCLFLIPCLAYRRVSLETHAKPSSEWVKMYPVNDSSVTLELIFALKQTNLDKLEKLFWAVSNPDSPSYGKYLTMEEVQALVKPTEETTSTVLEWISGFEVKEVKHVNDYVIVSVPLAVAEEMLACKFYHFEHFVAKKTIIRAATDYSLPHHVAEHVDFVGGVKHFPLLKEAPKTEKRNGQQDFSVTPRFLKDRYNIGSAVGQAKQNSQSVAQFLEQYFTRADLQEFFALFLQSAIGNEPTTVGPNNYLAGVEASLDIEYIMSTGEGIPTVFWSTGGLHDNQEPFLKWMIDVGNTQNAPLLFSVSYGDDEPTLTLDYVSRVNVEFQKQGLRGISILFASGDSGVGGSNFGGCKRFVPGYPATSPYVTAVGGTALEGWFETGEEIVNGLSGGGFSDFFSRPSYQVKAVQNYLTTMAQKLPPSNLWNNTGRGFPDISALSANFIVVADFVPLPGVAGTSCASPTVAGIFGLLNDLRLLAGKPSLGFLNPLLYKLAVDQPQVFTDIKKGSNPGCGTDGFSATTGWDPSSGLGSINYAEFAKIVNKY